MNWINSIDWKFIVGDIIIPIATFLIGLLTGGAVERHKAKAKIKGNQNIVIQNSEIDK